MADGGQIVLGKFIGGQLPIMKGYTLEDKALTSQTLKDKALTSQQNFEVFIPAVNCYEFSKVVSWLA